MYYYTQLLLVRVLGLVVEDFHRDEADHCRGREDGGVGHGIPRHVAADVTPATSCEVGLRGGGGFFGGFGLGFVCHGVLSFVERDNRGINSELHRCNI